MSSLYSEPWTEIRGNGDAREWDEYGLSELLGTTEMDFRCQDDDGPDQLRGQWFATPDATVSKGDLFVGCKVLFTGSFSQSHSPGALHYTTAYVFDATPEGEAALAKAVARWEAKPEYTAAYEARSAEDDAEDDDDTDALPTEPADGDYVTTDYRAWHVHQGRTRFVAGVYTWAAEVKAHMDAEQHWPNAWFLGERGDWNLLDLDAYVD